MRWYYAQIDENNICVGISDLSGEVNAPDMIFLGHEYVDVMGMRYNFDTGKWETVKEPVYYYYAIINDVNVVIDVIKSETEINDDKHIKIDPNKFSGEVYYNGTFMSLNEANYRMLLNKGAIAASEVFTATIPASTQAIEVDHAAFIIDTTRHSYTLEILTSVMEADNPATITGTLYANNGKVSFARNSISVINPVNITYRILKHQL